VRAELCSSRSPNRAKCREISSLQLQHTL